MTAALVRQLEVHVKGPADVDVAEGLVHTAVQQHGGGQTRVRLRRLGIVPGVAVSLRGPAEAVGKVANAIGQTTGFKIVRDAIDASSPGPEYPDPASRSRIGADVVLPSGPEVTVAIVDSGMMVDHAALRANAWGMGKVSGFRRIGPLRDHDVTDEDGHGTLVAGGVLAGALQSPAVKLMPVKFFDGSTRPAAANAAEGIAAAIDHGAHIVDLSFDVGIADTRLEQAIDAACRHGVLVVIAAGNDGADNDRFPSYPARYGSLPPDDLAARRPEAVVVMATDRLDRCAPFSNYGRKTVDLAAPGVAITSTYPSLARRAGPGPATYRRQSGTSMAAAYVAGAAALLKVKFPSFTAAQLKTRLVQAVDPVPGLACTSGGRLNLAKL